MGKYSSSSLEEKALSLLETYNIYKNTNDIYIKRNLEKVIREITEDAGKTLLFISIGYNKHKINNDHHIYEVNEMVSKWREDTFIFSYDIALEWVKKSSILRCSTDEHEYIHSKPELKFTLNDNINDIIEIFRNNNILPLNSNDITGISLVRVDTTPFWIYDILYKKDYKCKNDNHGGMIISQLEPSMSQISARNRISDIRKGRTSFYLIKDRFEIRETEERTKIVINPKSMNGFGNPDILTSFGEVCFKSSRRKAKSKN